MILEQKLNQSLKLSQTMKMSLNILEMSMLNLNNFIKNEFSNKFGVEVNYSKQETYNDDDRLELTPSIPILAKIEVSAANIADKIAKINHI